AHGAGVAIRHVCPLHRVHRFAAPGHRGIWRAAWRRTATPGVLVVLATRQWAGDGLRAVPRLERSARWRSADVAGGAGVWTGLCRRRNTVPHPRRLASDLLGAGDIAAGGATAGHDPRTRLLHGHQPGGVAQSG